MTVYDNLLRRSSRVVPVREGRVSVRPSGSGSYIDIGYCRIDTDEPAAITVKTGLMGRRVLGYNDRLEISWLQTSIDEQAAIETLQSGEHDIKLTRAIDAADGGGTEERIYSAYYLQILPNLQQGRYKIIAEKMLSVAQKAAQFGRIP